MLCWDCKATLTEREETMKRLLTYKFPIAATALLLALTLSCSHEPSIEPPEKPGFNVYEWEDSTINGDATMTRMVFSVNDSIKVVRQGETRATTTVAGITTFELNDAVTIGIAGRGAKDYKVTSVLTGTLAYDGTATDAYSWQSTNETVSLRAWSYGSATTTDDPDNAVYTLSENQISSYGELLYSPATDYDYSTYKNGIPLTLHHQLSRLVINLTHLNTGDLDVSEIYIGDGSTSTIPITARFHKPLSGNIGTWDEIGTEKGQITPKTETANTCYSAVLIPTTYVAGKRFIVIKTSDDKTYSYIPDADIVLAAGNQYNYTISVNDSDPGVELSASAVGYVVTTDAKCYAPSWTIPSGKTKAGVVTYKSGSSGYVVALFNCGGNINSDGNTYNWYGRNNGLSLVPAVSGRTWYVGSKDAYDAAIMNNWTNTMTLITNAGGRDLSSSKCWSESSLNADYAYHFHVSGWGHPHKSTYYGHVRPLIHF